MVAYNTEITLIREKGEYILKMFGVDVKRLLHFL